MATAKVGLERAATAISRRATQICSIRICGRGFQPALPEQAPDRSGNLALALVAAGFPAAAVLLALAFLAGAFGAGRLPAAEPNGLQAALAIQDALVDAIAKSEKSVVAITRIDGDGGAAAGLATIEIGPGGGLPQVQAPCSPSDPDFVPDAFATGVVVG